MLSKVKLKILKKQMKNKTESYCNYLFFISDNTNKTSTLLSNETRQCPKEENYIKTTSSALRQTKGNKI